MKLLGPYQDFGGAELRNWRFQVAASAPSAPAGGQPYYNSGNKAAYYWNETSWRPFDAALLTDGSIKIAGLEVDPRQRSTHTGTQLAATISDLASTVKAYSLDMFAAPVAAVSFGNQRITLVANASAGTDATPLNQVNSLISAAIQGITAIKQPVRMATTTNITLSGLQTIDGISGAANDRVLVRAQTDATKNLIYLMQSGAWTIALDDDGVNELIEGTQVLVNEGSTYGGSTFRITTTGTITPGTTSITWVQVAQAIAYTADETTLHLTGSQFSARLAYGLTVVTGGIQVQAITNGGIQVTSGGIGILLPTGSGLVIDATGLHIDISSTIATSRITQGTITGDGSTTQFTLTHNLNTRRVVPVFQDSSYNAVAPDWTATTVNTITVIFGSPPANGTVYSVSIAG